MVTYQVIGTTQDSVTIDLDIDGEVSRVDLLGFHSDNQVLFDQEVRIYAAGTTIGVEYSVEQVDGMIDVGLAVIKEVKIVEIDTKTSALIRDGLPFDGHKFDMDTEAQGNWTNLYYGVTTNVLPLPVQVATIDDQTYTFSDKTKVTQFYLTGLGFVQTLLASGRTLKTRVNNAVSIEDVITIVDHR